MIPKVGDLVELGGYNSGILTICKNLKGYYFARLYHGDNIPCSAERETIDNLLTGMHHWNFIKVKQDGVWYNYWNCEPFVGRVIKD
jgi:hypothetical protein